MRKQTQLATLILAASLAAVAQNSAVRVYRSGSEWIEESNGSLAAGKTVRVKTTAGAIKAQGGEQNNVHYVVAKRVCASSEESARKEFSLMRLSASSYGDIAFLRAESGRRLSHVSADFEVHVPYHTALLKLDTDGGNVNAANISGQVDANTGGGAIQLDQIGGAGVARGGAGPNGNGQNRSAARPETAAPHHPRIHRRAHGRAAS